MFRDYQGHADRSAGDFYLIWPETAPTLDERGRVRAGFVEGRNQVGVYRILKDGGHG